MFSQKHDKFTIKKVNIWYRKDGWLNWMNKTPLFDFYISIQNQIKIEHTLIVCKKRNKSLSNAIMFFCAVVL